MTLSQTIASKFPNLKYKLKGAGIDKKPHVYIKECLSNALVLSFLMSILFLLMLSKLMKDTAAIIFLLLLFFFIFCFMLFFVLFKKVDVEIQKRAKEIDKDVLFAGRFLLVKLNSGKPLMNSLTDASTSYGVASKYFQEIVREIDLGTPMEEALEKACATTPSTKFRKILFQITNALKIGVDVSVSLEATLEEITQEQLVEIQRYGKKLNSLTMFYMLLAVVAPSLGITLFSVIASMISINMNFQTFFVILFFLFLMQIMFISLFRSIRPNLNL